MQTEEVVVGRERFVYTNRERTLSPTIVADLLAILERWTAFMPPEPTFAMREYGVPSLIARFDGTLEGDIFRVYEIQSGPSWIGYAGLANPAFKAARDVLARRWPRFKLLMPRSERHDDELWLEQISFEEALRTDHPLLIRRMLLRNIDPAIASSLIARSVKAQFDQNDKRYGVEFGWWKPVAIEHIDALPWNEAFVLKPVQSHGSGDVMFWDPLSRAGRSTRTQIIATMEKHELMYLQPLYPPQRITLNGRDYRMMLRPFFGFDPLSRKWQPMHGVWTARPFPTYRLHGASDAISGPLMTPSPAGAR